MTMPASASKPPPKSSACPAAPTVTSVAADAVHDTLTREDVHFLCALALQAGRAILPLYALQQRQQLSVERKSDGSPLTAADLLADRIIRQGLNDRFPNINVVSEEHLPATLGDDAAPLFLVDPLDGTKEFCHGNGEFTVNIALIEQQRPTVGVVYVPVTGDCFFAAASLGAWRFRAEPAPETERYPTSADAIGTETEIHTLLAAAQAITTSKASKLREPPAMPLRVIASRSHGSDGLNAWLDRLPTPYTLVQAGSSLKFCRLAAGEADIYPRFAPTQQWDTAAGEAVLRAAGGELRTTDGTALSYGFHRTWHNPHFIAVGDPALWSETGIFPVAYADLARHRSKTTGKLAPSCGALAPTHCQAANTALAAATVASMSSAVWAMETKPASKAEGAK